MAPDRRISLSCVRPPLFFGSRMDQDSVAPVGEIITDCENTHDEVLILTITLLRSLLTTAQGLELALTLCNRSCDHFAVHQH